MKNVMSDRKSLFEELDRKLDRAEKRKQNKTGKGKESVGKIWWKAGANFRESFPSGVSQGTIISATNCDTM